MNFLRIIKNIYLYTVYIHVYAVADPGGDTGVGPPPLQVLILLENKIGKHAI